ncbi:MAG: glycosyltransferase family 1 protein [Lentisphaeria bacterium]
MKITLISETYFPQVNGVSRALGRLVSSLAENGDRVQLIIPQYAEEDIPGSFPDGTQSVRLKGFAFPFYKDVKLIFCRPASIRRYLNKFNPDIVHIATEGPMGWLAMRSMGKLQLPLVTSFHTNFPSYLGFYKLGWLQGVAWKYLRWFHNRGRVTFCPTKSIKEQLEARKFKNVVVWGRGVECERFKPDYRSPEVRRGLGVADEDVALLYVGRIAEEKNLSVLFDAVDRLEGVDIPWKLIMVGDGPARRQLAARAGGKVIFTGYKMGEELASVYASSDCFVFPSLTDTFGNVILEGMASGLPVVGFDAPGPRDIISHGGTGLLVKERTPDALAAGMAKLVKDRELRLQLALNARKYALSCRWDRINGVVRSAYQEVLGNQ